MAKDEKNKKNKESKSNKSFIKESKSELKKVNWPKPKQLATDTSTVIGIVLIVAIIVFILDFIFLTLNENLVAKTEQNIKNSTNSSIVNNAEDVSNSDNSTIEEIDQENSDIIQENEGPEEAVNLDDNNENPVVPEEVQ